MSKKVYELKTTLNDQGEVTHREMKNIKLTHLFGLISITYYVEDRRPDLEDGDYPGKYKHYINMKIFRKRYNWTFRTRWAYEDLPYE